MTEAARPWKLKILAIWSFTAPSKQPASLWVCSTGDSTETQFIYVTNVPVGYSLAHSGGSTQPLRAQTLEHWVPSRWNCLGIIRTYSFVGGGLSLGFELWGFRNPHACFTCGSRCKLSDAPVTAHLLYRHGLWPSETINPLNTFFYKLTGSWCFITTIRK